MRPAPRRAGSAGSRIRWDKAGRVALVCVLFFVCLLYVKPVIGFFDAWRDSKSEQATLAELKLENEALDQRARTLNAPDAPERAGRELGMVTAGEQPYTVTESIR